MDFIAKLDPEVALGLGVFPDGLITAIGDNPALAQEMFTELMGAMAEMLPPTEVQVEERMIAGPDGEIPVFIYQPPGAAPRAGLRGYMAVAISSVPGATMLPVCLSRSMSDVPLYPSIIAWHRQ